MSRVRCLLWLLGCNHRIFSFHCVHSSMGSNRTNIFLLKTYYDFDYIGFSTAIYNLCSFPLRHNGGIIKADDSGLSPLCVDLLRWFLLLHVRYLDRLSFFVLCAVVENQKTATIKKSNFTLQNVFVWNCQIARGLK